MSAVISLSCVLALGLLLGGCGPGGEGPWDVAAPASKEALPVKPVTNESSYRVSRGDVLEVSVYQTPSLNRTVEVDGTGQFALPLIGSVKAEGRTVRELERDVAGLLGARYLQSPDVSIFLKDAVGQRITIDGAVRKPGVMQARGETTLLRALAEAQGFTETADLAGVMVFRQTPQGKVGARFDANAIRSGKMEDPPIYGGDTIVVDESSGKLVWRQFRDALPVAGLFRMF